MKKRGLPPKRGSGPPSKFTKSSAIDSGTWTWNLVSIYMGILISRWRRSLNMVYLFVLSKNRGHNSFWGCGRISGPFGFLVLNVASKFFQKNFWIFFILTYINKKPKGSEYTPAPLNELWPLFFDKTNIYTIFKPVRQREINIPI